MPAKKKDRPRFIYTDAEILKELRRVYRHFGRKPFSRRGYEAYGTISKTTIETRFGTWTKALAEAGLLGKFETART